MSDTYTRYARNRIAVPKAVLEKADAVAALSMADFDVTRHTEFLEALGKRLGKDFSTTLLVLRHLPVLHNPPEHGAVRKVTAQFVARHKDRARAGLARIIAEEFAALDSPAGTELDLMPMVLRAVDRTLGELSGLTLEIGRRSVVSQVFSTRLGVAGRVEIEQEFASQLAALKISFPGESDSELAIRLGILVMGRDPMTSTAGLSIYHHLMRCDGKPINGEKIPAVPTHTGLPYIGRVTNGPVTIGGCALSAGDLVECRLDSFNKGSDMERVRFFGAGAHLCLGRVIALDFFAEFSRFLQRQTVRLKVLSFALKDDEVFDMPSHLTVRIL